MVLELLAVWRRPSTEVPFFQKSTDYINYVESTYVESGRMSFSESDSEDGLSKTMSLKFASEADMIAFRDDPEMQDHKRLKDEYNANHGILSTAEVRAI